MLPTYPSLNTTHKLGSTYFLIKWFLLGLCFYYNDTAVFFLLFLLSYCFYCCKYTTLCFILFIYLSFMYIKMFLHTYKMMWVERKSTLKDIYNNWYCQFMADIRVICQSWKRKWKRGSIERGICMYIHMKFLSIVKRFVQGFLETIYHKCFLKTQTNKQNSKCF